MNRAVGREYHGIGHAKLLLFGEHAAVYAYPAVGVGLPDCTRLSLIPSNDETWRAPDLPPPYRPWFDALTAALEAEIPADAVRGRVHLVSSVPVAQGFGSSATLCTALAQAALRALTESETVADRKVWSLANRLERVFHGTPSGIDTGLAIHQGVTAFSFDGDELPGARRIDGGDFFLVAGSVPRSAGTKELVGAIGTRMREGDRRTAELLAELGRIATDACDAIPAAVDVAGRMNLAALAGRAHRALEALGLGNDRLNQCLSRGMEAGALGGKLSGAGGGGAFYLICHDRESADSVSRGLAESGIMDAATIRSVAIQNRATA